MPFKEGFDPNRNLNGRPKGKTLKEWLKDKLAEMDEEQREVFLKDIPKDMQWRMAEGNPAQDIGNKDGKPFVIQIAKEVAIQNDIDSGTSPDSSR